MTNPRFSHRVSRWPYPFGPSSISGPPGCQNLRLALLTILLWFCTFDIMRIRNLEIFELQASFCQTLSNPKRLMIVALLSMKEMSVGELAENIDTALATVSQHLTVLRNKHIVESRKEGQTVYYRLTDTRLMEACILIRTVLLDLMKKRGEIAKEIEIDPIGISES